MGQPAGRRLHKIKYNENNDLTNDRLKVSFLINPEAEIWRSLGFSLEEGSVCAHTANRMKQAVFNEKSD